MSYNISNDGAASVLLILQQAGLDYSITAVSPDDNKVWIDVDVEPGDDMVVSIGERTFALTFTEDEIRIGAFR